MGMGEISRPTYKFHHERLFSPQVIIHPRDHRPPGPDRGEGGQTHHASCLGFGLQEVWVSDVPVRGAVDLFDLRGILPVTALSFPTHPTCYTCTHFTAASPSPNPTQAWGSCGVRGKGKERGRFGCASVCEKFGAKDTVEAEQCV